MASPSHTNALDEKMDRSRLGPDEAPLSPVDEREQASRLVDDLELLRAERLVSHQEQEAQSRRSKSRHHGAVPQDTFNQVEPSQQASKQQPPTTASKLWVKIKKFPRVIRYFVYMTPVAAILLAPVLIDQYAVPGQNVPVGGPGGVRLLWFGIWLEILWGSLWASRIICAIMPYLFKWCAKAVGSSNYKKWKDIGYDLELPTALFVWMLAVLCSFLPTLNSHRDTTSGEWDGNNPPFIQWIDIVNKVIIALFVLVTLNVAEKIMIQWIASSFHVRTYAYRIEANKQQIQYLIQLYEHSRSSTHDETVWDPRANTGSSGAKTPLQAFQANARQALNRFGNVANRMAGDFTGRKILNENHPRKVVLELLRTTPTSHTLARLLFRTFVAPDRSTIVLEDFQRALPTTEEAEACFGVFDKDLNGDVSMEELEMVCNEIHLEKKAIAASLKDLDSVIRKLDKVFLFIIFVIDIIVFISIISGSAAAALGSAGTTLLGLAWMLQATAQEFLQSIIFVFVKHPFDVGDRVRVYGNTGAIMQGDDYYVQEISLLYTEFKKMEGHVVQAPNSLLNNLFILNQRRSNGLADPIELKIRFGTKNEVIEELKARMLDFVMEHKRDYAPRIITEVKTIDEVWSVTMNFIFFHKSNFQNELLRLQRHNKFASELMRQMDELGIEGPRKHQPGGNRDFPFFWANIQPPSFGSSAAAPAAGAGPAGGPVGAAGNNPSGANPQFPYSSPPTSQPQGMMPSSPFSPPPSDPQQPVQGPPPNIAPSPELRRRRAESRVAHMDSSYPDFGNVYDSRRLDAAANLARLQSIRAASAAESRGVGGGVGPSPSAVAAATGLDRTNTMGRSPSLMAERVQSRSSATGPGAGHRFFGRQRTIPVMQQPVGPSPAGGVSGAVGPMSGGAPPPPPPSAQPTGDRIV